MHVQSGCFDCHSLDVAVVVAFKSSLFSQVCYTAVFRVVTQRSSPLWPNNLNE